MKQAKFIIVLVILAAFLIIGAGCETSQQGTNTRNQGQKEVVTAKLTSVTGGNLSQSAGYYEGSLVFQDISNMTEYNMFLCTGNWSVVKLNSCYNLNLTEIAQNVENHKFSSELSGCYVGTLTEVSC